MAKKKSNKIKLAVVKYKALELRANRQIPLQLAHHINLLTNDDDKAWIEYLMIQSQHMLRVKGYYKKFPSLEKEFNDIIVKAFEEYQQRKSAKD